MEALGQALERSQRVGTIDGAAVPRPRPLQARQRHAWATRPATGCSSRSPHRLRGSVRPGRHRGPPRRRRVRDRWPSGWRPRRRHRRWPTAIRDAVARARSRCPTGPVDRHGVDRRGLRRRPRRPSACCATPTSPSTGPRSRAGTAGRGLRRLAPRGGPCARSPPSSVSAGPSTTDGLVVHYQPIVDLDDGHRRRAPRPCCASAAGTATCSPRLVHRGGRGHRPDRAGRRGRARRRLPRAGPLAPSVLGRTAPAQHVGQRVGPAAGVAPGFADARRPQRSTATASTPAPHARVHRGHRHRGRPGRPRHGRRAPRAGRRACAIDDFGTGYSLARLPQAVPGRHREARPLLRRRPRRRTRSDTEIVRAVLALGQSLGLSVVAEGVETPEQLARLQDLGCHFGPGLPARLPGPPDQLDATPATSRPSPTSPRTGDQITLSDAGSDRLRGG